MRIFFVTNDLTFQLGAETSPCRTEAMKLFATALARQSLMRAEAVADRMSNDKLLQS